MRTFPTKSLNKPIFFTSDWHVGHRNVISFSNRPFTDIEHMERVLINNFNASVPTNGVTYFLGDMGLTDWFHLQSVISQLNGTKVLVLGNHDKASTTMYQVGFDVVLHGAWLQIAGEKVTLSHCPLKGVYRENTEGMHGSPEGENWHGESRKSHEIYTCSNEGQFHLSGHIHSPNSGKSQRTLGRQMDVGVDANSYRPVSHKQVAEWIALVKRQEKEKARGLP